MEDQSRNTEELIQIRLRPAPIVKMLVVTVIVALIIIYIYAALRTLPNFESIMTDHSWLVADLVHAPQFLVPFMIICWITRGSLGEYGFNLRQNPPVFTHNRLHPLLAVVIASIDYLKETSNQSLETR